MPLGAGGSEIGTRLSEAKVIFRQIGEVPGGIPPCTPKIRSVFSNLSHANVAEQGGTLEN